MWPCTHVRMLGVGNCHYDDCLPHHSRASSSSSNWHSIFDCWAGADWRRSLLAGTAAAAAAAAAVLDIHHVLALDNHRGLVLESYHVLGRDLVHVLFPRHGRTVDNLGTAVDTAEEGLDMLVRAVLGVPGNTSVLAALVGILAVLLLLVVEHMLAVWLGRRLLEDPGAGL